MRLTPLHTALVGDEFAIAWNDGTESYLKCEFLRRHCPCAACGGEADILGRVAKPTVTYTPTSFVLQSWQDVGGYSLQPIWGDGHKSGLYTFPLLQRLSQAQTPTA